MPNFIARNRAAKFSLIEIITVVGIVALLCALGASAHHKMKRELRLSIAGGAVKSTLDQAKAFALRYQKVVAVYFIDGGINRGEKLQSEVNEAYLKSADKKNAAYQMAVWLYDPDGHHNDRELARTVLPDGIIWLDVGVASSDVSVPEYHVNYTNENGVAKTAVVANPLYHRWCSLVIKFAPSGNAWAEILRFTGERKNQFAYFDRGEVLEPFLTADGELDPAKLMEAIDKGSFPINELLGAGAGLDSVPWGGGLVRGKNSAMKIRLTPLDNLKFAADGTFTEQMPFEYSLDTDFSEFSIGLNPIDVKIYNWKNRKKTDVSLRVYWKTVSINYPSGVSRLVNGYNEEPP